MSQERRERDLLEELLAVSKENNQILRQWKRYTEWSFFATGVKYALILGPLIVGFLYLQPYFEKIDKVYNFVSKVSVTTNLNPDQAASFMDNLKKLWGSVSSDEKP